MIVIYDLKTVSMIYTVILLVAFSLTLVVKYKYYPFIDSDEFYKSSEPVNLDPNHPEYEGYHGYDS